MLVVLVALCMMLGIIKLCSVFKVTSANLLFGCVMTVFIVGMGVSEGTADAAKKGTYQYNDDFNSVYEGELNDEGMPHGNGEIYYTDDQGEKRYIYIGEFDSGNYHGKGTLFVHTLTKEPAISGVFENSNPVLYPYENEFYLTGEGIEFKGDPAQIKTGKKMVVYYERGNVYYEGSWKNNNINGKGTTYHNYHEKTPKEKGKFENGLLLGNGKVYHENGKMQFKGKFKKKGMLHGYGLSGTGTEYYENGKVKYKGGFKGGDYDGKGKAYYENGELTYNGKWKNGEPDGKGKLYYENGELAYNGKWKKGKYHGKGTTYTEKGEVIQKGTFKNGQFVE